MNVSQRPFPPLKRRYGLGAFALAMLLAACAQPPNPPAGAPPAGAHWRADPGELVFTGEVGALAPAPRRFELANTGEGPGAFVLETRAPWLHVQPASGRLQPGETLNVEVRADPCATPGTSSGEIALRGTALRVHVTRSCRSVNRAPQAELSAQPTSGTAPLTVDFTLSESDPDGDALSCSLDFGDGVVHSGCGNTSHTYTEPGRYTARYSVSDGSLSVTDTVSVTVAATGSDEGFDIRILFVSEPDDPDVRAAFENAAARWQQVITGDLRDVQADIPAGACLESNPGYKGAIDDLLIVADVAPINGSGGILGMAGPCYVRGGSGQPDYFLPYFGVMKFDSADLDRMKQNGTLEPVILHEMGHVLGLGTLWDAGPFDYLNHDGASCQEASEVSYDGVHAADAWHALGSVGEVPVENTGGSGTKCGHWREATFGNELMTGWISGAAAPLSRVTAGSLDDLGYAVNYAAADGYAPPSGNAATLGVGEPLEETLIFPEPPSP